MAKIEIPVDTTRKKSSDSSERKKAKPIVTNDKIIRRKKPLSQKIVGKFIAEDIDDVKDYVVNDLIIPGLIDTFLDTISMLLGREGDYSSRGRKNHRNGYYDYAGRSSYKGRTRRSRDDGRRRDRRRHSEEDIPEYDNIVVKNRNDAEDIVDEMYRRIDENGDVSIAEFFDLLDLTAPYTDNKWGWTRKSQIDIRKVSGGFLIDVEEARYLD